MKGKLPAEVAKTTLGEASSFSLAWTFMGHSYLYILFVGVAQLIGAWFLLWNKTKLIGVFILIPIMINIIVFDIIFLDVYPALANAIIVFIMLLSILYCNEEKMAAVFRTLTIFPEKPNVQLKRKILTIVTTIAVIILIFAFDSLIEHWLGASKEKIIE
jgi:predicted membrane-bound mannosyltransferase